MVKFHIELLFLKHKNKFFVAPDSVIPQLEFLTTGSAVKHLHRSIKALTDEDQQHVVYLSLRTVVSHALRTSPIVNWVPLTPTSLQDFVGTSFSMKRVDFPQH
ncbi:hypothetical protein H4Q26_005631 [Puccinia striiformis f. sp. tritici PST-130]|nr:hypothetical protein H4Q26_005631 [Puccinia striiformis f. sp. tritici PST-130]